KVDFGGGALGDGTSHQMFVACYDRDMGGFKWAKAFAAPGPLTPRAMGVANDGSVLVVGDTDGAPSFAPMAMPAGASDVFVLRLIADGDVTWAKLFGGPLGDSARAARVGGGGDVTFAGGFRGEADFGAPKPLASVGGEDVFLASVDGD